MRKIIIRFDRKAELYAPFVVREDGYAYSLYSDYRIRVSNQ